MTNQEKLKQILKRDDQLLPKLFVRPIANRIVGLIGDSRITPNQISLFSFMLSLIAMLCILQPGYLPLFIAGVIIQISWIFDSVDGQLARYKGIKTAFGGWLDMMLDVIKLNLLPLFVGWRYYAETENIIWLITGFTIGFFFSIQTIIWESRKVLVQNKINDKLPEKLSLIRKLKKYAHFGGSGINLFLGFCCILNYPKILFVIAVLLLFEFIAVSYYLWAIELKHEKN